MHQGAEHMASLTFHANQARHMLEEIVQREGLANCVTFLGSVVHKELPRLYRSARYAIGISVKNRHSNPFPHPHPQYPSLEPPSFCAHCFRCQYLLEGHYFIETPELLGLIPIALSELAIALCPISIALLFISYCTCSFPSHSRNWPLHSALYLLHSSSSPIALVHSHRTLGIGHCTLPYICHTPPHLLLHLFIPIAL